MLITDPAAKIPSRWEGSEFQLRPITIEDAALDHAALMETREDLRLWEQSSWPEDDFTVAANREELAGLQQRHDEHRAFTYTVLNPAGDECLGCVYIFPISASFLRKAEVTPVGEWEWSEVQAVVYFWTRLSRTRTGMDARLLASLRSWLSTEWELEKVVYVTNEQFTQQAELIAGTDLHLVFELREPDKAGTYLVYG